MKQSQKQTLRKVAGDLSGLYGIRDLVWNDGRGKGMRTLELRGDKGLECTVLTDRCMDIPYLSYKGINIGVATKAGISAPWFYTENGTRGFLKQFNAGMFTTCGISYSGSPEEVDGRAYGLHGSIGNSPAENVSRYEECVDDEVVLCATGSVREACVFAESLMLHRHIRMYTEQNLVEVRDVIENCGFGTEPLMMLYHVNFGYPLVDKGARMYFSAPNTEPRDEAAAANLSKHTLMEAAEIDRPEECFTHTGAHGIQRGVVYNSELGLAAAVHYDADALPVLCQWKCCHAGDYALGMEPSVSGYWGRRLAEEKGLMRYIEPGESMDFTFEIEVTDNASRINALMGK